MSVDTNKKPEIDDDLNTTAPQSEPDAWKMPDPVFRRTSGKLPQGFAREQMGDGTGEISVPPAEPSSDPGVPIMPAPVVKPQSPILKMLLVLLGLGAMIAFLVVFLTVLYFFFWRSD